MITSTDYSVLAKLKFIFFNIATHIIFSLIIKEKKDLKKKRDLVQQKRYHLTSATYFNQLLYSNLDVQNYQI